jgi:hypothetical protein
MILSDGNDLKVIAKKASKIKEEFQEWQKDYLRNMFDEAKTESQMRAIISVTKELGYDTKEMDDDLQSELLKVKLSGDDYEFPEEDIHFNEHPY